MSYYDDFFTYALAMFCGLSAAITAAILLLLISIWWPVAPLTIIIILLGSGAATGWFVKRKFD